MVIPIDVFGALVLITGDCISPANTELLAISSNYR
jgi:hypothetical protein